MSLVQVVSAARGDRRGRKRVRALASAAGVH